LKTNTELAVSFLKSCFGKRLLKNQNFRIISDMKRENEYDSSNAGCNLMHEINKLGFTECKKMIFTSNK